MKKFLVLLVNFYLFFLLEVILKNVEKIVKENIRALGFLLKHLHGVLSNSISFYLGKIFFKFSNKFFYFCDS